MLTFWWPWTLIYYCIVHLVWPTVSAFICLIVQSHCICYYCQTICRYGLLYVMSIIVINISALLNETRRLTDTVGPWCWCVHEFSAVRSLVRKIRRRTPVTTIHTQMLYMVLTAVSLTGQHKARTLLTKCQKHLPRTTARPTATSHAYTCAPFWPMFERYGQLHID